MPGATDPVTVVSDERRRVVYIEGDPSLEIIMAALEAWGLRVRAERERAPAARADAEDHGRAPALAPAQPIGAAPAAWVTMRPQLPRVSRLENILSPLWFPARQPLKESEPVTAFSWFGRAA